MQKVFAQIDKFMSGYGFPLWVIGSLISIVISGTCLLLVPLPQGELAAFAEDFKIWCFGYDPATGSLELGYLVTFFLMPTIILTSVVGIWSDSLVVAWQKKRQAMFHLASSMFFVLLGFAALIGFYQPEKKGELPFPAESLRTEFFAPNFTLTNHEGKKVSLEDFRGQVVMLTGVYSRCGYTCPMIMAQSKETLKILSAKEKENLTVFAITLDPEHDTPENLKQMALSQNVQAPLFQLLTESPDYVHKILDLYSFTRTKDPKTGVIDHVNFFILIDREGRLAYRFTLGERQEKWLIKALRLLLQEVETQKKLEIVQE